MKPQTIVTSDGERLVVLAEAAYLDLLEAAEDAADIRAVDEFRRKLAAGEEELLPSDLVGRLLTRENPVLVWREYRQLTLEALVAKAGVEPDLIERIEAGTQQGSIETMRKIAVVLSVDLDDLAGSPEAAEAASL